MKKFSIYYNSPFCKYNAFNIIEEFDSYDIAVDYCISNNKFNVEYPELIKISKL